MLLVNGERAGSDLKEIFMTPEQASFLAHRASGVMLDAKRKPECAEAARKFLQLAVRYAERHGVAFLAADFRKFEKAIV